MSKKINFIIFTLIIFFSAKILFAQNLTASITIDTQKPLKDTTSRKVFGAFVEFLNDFINGPQGMWAQEFMDRGFDLKNCTNTYFGCVWNDYITSPTDSVNLIEGGYNPNGEYFKRLIGKSADSKTGTFQTIVSNDTVSYTFYIYFKGYIENGSFKLSIFDAAMKNELFTTDIGTPDSIWRKVMIKVPAIKGFNRLNYFIHLDGIGTVDIDESSCVPDDNFMGVRREHYKFFKDMNVGIMRYQGGCFSDTPSNMLQYCIGDID